MNSSVPSSHHSKPSLTQAARHLLPTPVHSSPYTTPGFRLRKLQTRVRRSICATCTLPLASMYTSYMRPRRKVWEKEDVQMVRPEWMRPNKPDIDLVPSAFNGCAQVRRLDIIHLDIMMYANVGCRCRLWWWRSRGFLEIIDSGLRDLRIRHTMNTSPSPSSWVSSTSSSAPVDIVCCGFKRLTQARSRRPLSVNLPTTLYVRDSSAKSRSRLFTSATNYRYRIVAR